MTFRPGQVGNPSGFSNASQLASKRAILYATSKAEKAMRTAYKIMQTGQPDSVRLAAANTILDRALGKAVERREDTLLARFVLEAPALAVSTAAWLAANSPLIEGQATLPVPTVTADPLPVDAAPKEPIDNGSGVLTPNDTNGL